jgi:hypothetical protein
MYKIHILFFVFLSVFQANAFEPEGVKWISSNEKESEANQWFCFRKTLDIDGRVEKADFYIAVDSKYWLWVNGKPVIFEGGLKRGPNPRDTYVDRIDLAAYLTPGRNTLAILMWYWGKDGYCHKSSGKPGLLAVLDLGKVQVSTDETWKAIVHPAYGPSSEPYPNYRLPEANIHFDARKDPENWTSPDFPDAGWENAKALGVYPCAPWNKLHERPIPNWFDSGIVDYVELSEQTEGNHRIIQAKLPRNITVTPYLKIKSKEGRLIDIRTDNYKGGSEYNVRAEYVTKNGIQEFEAFNYVNGHHVLYTMPEDVEIIALGYRETRYNTRHVGSFTCSDDFFNTLWQKSLHTMNLNMRDAIQDPDRERSQWWGDAVIVSGEIFYSCDADGVKAVRKAILNLADWQKEDGVLYSPVPAGSWDRELPAQMLASVGKYGFWNYYLYSGDRALIAHVYPTVKKYLSLWKIKDTGLIAHRGGGWDWLDWGTHADTSVIDNAWFCLALEAAREMAVCLGYDDEALVYSQMRRSIAQAVNRHLWNGEVYRDPPYKGHTDDRANGLAVLAGFADREKWESIRSFLLGYANASPYMEKYILESFFLQNDAVSGLERMKKRYQYMVDHELTTLWEDWQIGGHGGGSINHGWAGGPLTLLSQYVAGVMPLEPGWKSFLVKPQPGNLEWVNCTVPAGRETIRVQIKNEQAAFSLAIDHTLQSAFTVAVPKIRGQAISINDQSYDPDNLSAIKENFIQYTDADEDYVYFSARAQKLNIRIERLP